jgi:selenocysteine-specific elongation factor
VIIGTAGHIDHGKTALVKALTGVDTDRLQEEKARGITIDLGFAYQPLPDGRVLGFVDVPGHEKFIHNMLAGATGIDYVLLVVAADDGPMPQTLEHLQILDLLGLTRGAVAITKCDLASPERVEEVGDQVRSLLSSTALAGAPLFPVAALGGRGIPELAAHLQATAQDTPARSAGGHFRLAVDRCFTMSGAGIVVTGTVFSGRVQIGDRLVLSPPGIELRVRGIHAQNRAADFGTSGQRCALNLAGPQLEKARVHRGDWVLDEAVHTPSQRLDCRLSLLAAEAQALRHWTPVHVHLGTADVMGRAALLEGDAVQPGARCLAQLVLDRPAGALRGDRFIMRDQSARRTLGGGVVLDPFPPQRGRRSPQRFETLAAHEAPTPRAALHELLKAVPAGVDLRRFSLSWNLTPEEGAALWPQVPMVTVAAPAQTVAFSNERWQCLRQETVAALGRYHASVPDVPGPDMERLRLLTPDRLPKAVFAGLIEQLIRAQQLVRDGPWLRLPGHEARLTPTDERLWNEVRPLLARGMYQPPRVRDIARTLRQEETAVRQLMRRVARLGKTLQVAHDHYFLRATVAELAARAQDLAAHSPAGQLGAAEFRDRIGTGRKLAIQLLEFFDRVGFTLRVGDLRRIRQDYAAVFGESEHRPPSRILKAQV